MIEKIGLGTVQFGLDYGISNKQGITSENDVRKMLNYAASKGIKLLDTAYGYGKSEEVLGSVGVKNFEIVSKFLPATFQMSIKDQVNASLHRLGINHLFGLLAHRPLDIIENPGIWDFLLFLKQEKVVQKIGFSFNTTDEADLLLGKGLIPDLVQVPFNYLDQRFQSYMVKLKSLGCEIHSRSPFLQGLFFSDPDQLDVFFNEVKPIIKQLQANSSRLPDLLLKFCLQMPFIDKVIFGVNSIEQLMTNIELLNLDGSLDKNTYQVRSEILTPSKWPKKL